MSNKDIKKGIAIQAEADAAKVEKLATICTEGVSKMAEIKLKNGDSDDTYNEWAGKLQEVYTTQAQQVQDAYTSVATGQ